MAYIKSPYNEKIPAPVAFVCSLILLIIALGINGIYTSNFNDWVGGLGIRTEDIMFANNAMMVGLVSVMPIILRLIQRFKWRSLLLVSFSALLLLTTINMYATSFVVLTISNLFLGMFKMVAIMILFMPVAGLLMKDGKRVRLYMIIYPISISLGQLSGWVGASQAFHHHWQLMYEWTIPILIVAIGLVLIAFSNGRMSRKIPLYHVDWLSMIIGMVIMMLINYIFVYGKFEDWLSSPNIIIALNGTLWLSVLFYFRQQHRRSFVSFSFFKHGNVRVAFILIILFQLLFCSGGVQSAFVSSVIRLDGVRLAILNLWMIPGIAAAAIFTYIWFKKEKSLRYYILSGFAALVIYHLIFIGLFSPGTAREALYIPLMFKGFGFLVLFIGISLFVSDGLPMHSMIMCMYFFLIARSVIPMQGATALYNQALYEGMKDKTTQLVSKMDINDPNVQARMQSTYKGAVMQGRSTEDATALAKQSLYGAVQVQAVMTTAKEIFIKVVIGGLLICLYVIVVPMDIRGRKRTLLRLRQHYRRVESALFIPS